MSKFFVIKDLIIERGSIRLMQRRKNRIIINMKSDDYKLAVDFKRNEDARAAIAYLVVQSR